MLVGLWTDEPAIETNCTLTFYNVTESRRQFMSKTQEIIEVMRDYQQCVDNDDNPDVDPYEYGSTNHWIRRFFRCWLDGSYNGEGHYRRNIAYIKQYKDDDKKMRSFVISEFIPFILREFDCSYSTARVAITKALTKKQLETLNQELIADALNLIVDMDKDDFIKNDKRVTQMNKQNAAIGFVNMINNLKIKQEDLESGKK